MNFGGIYDNARRLVEPGKQEYKPFAGKKCPWCGEEYNYVTDNCGWRTWSSWGCQFCGKFLAEGWYVPDAAKGPNTKVVITEPIGYMAGYSREIR